MDSYVVQITNIAPTTTPDQIHTLFSFLGAIDEFELFPKIPDPGNVGTKVAFVKFKDGSSVGVAQHLTNTVFIDRPLICVPYNEGIIPDEATALQFVAPANAVAGLAGMQAGSMDPSKLDEIRRTIYVGNLDSKTATAEQLMQFFSSCGEVKFVRMAGDETQPTRFAFVEFSDVDNVQKAMQMNGALFGDRPLKINHSNNAIVKPPGKAQESSSNEIDEAMRRVREAQTLIAKALDPDKIKRSRSRSRSRHRRRRSRSRDRSRRRRSRSRSHGKSRRSRSRERRRSRRSRSRSRERRRKRSRSYSPRRKSGSRSPSKKSSKSHRKDRKRDRDHKHSKNTGHSKDIEKSEDGKNEKLNKKSEEIGQNGKKEVAD